MPVFWRKKNNADKRVHTTLKWGLFHCQEKVKHLSEKRKNWLKILPDDEFKDLDKIKKKHDKMMKLKNPKKTPFFLQCDYLSLFILGN